MTKKQKAMVFRIVATFMIYIPLAVAEHMELLAAKGSLSWLALYLIPYLLIGWDIIYKALRNIGGFAERQSGINPAKGDSTL